MKCSQYWFLFILIYVPTKKSNCQFVPLVEENNEKFNFSFIVEENSKVDEFMDTCPLKVLGGREINITEAPYQVAIRKKILYGYIWEAFCGGSLITMTYVVTAAHCFINNKGRFRVLSSWRVIAGTTKTRITLFSSSSEEQWSNIKNVYKHKFYNSKLFENDLAIVEVLKPFTTTNAVKPIRLHNLKRDKEIEKGLYCSVSGFGLKENSKVSLTLNSVCVPIVSTAKCSMYFYEEYLHPSTFCAGASGKDSCQGDSGGPLVCYGVLVGVVAWGGVCGVQPGVYTRISTYTSAENVEFEKNNAFIEKASSFFIISLLLIDDYIL